jgi:thioredoxin 1
MADVTELSDVDFESEALRASQPVLVDFWAPWCGPCRAITPVLHQLATEYAERVKIVKVNVDESPATASGYGVSAIPTIMLFKDGQVVDRFVGVQSKARLQEALTQAIG